MINSSFHYRQKINAKSSGVGKAILLILCFLWLTSFFRKKESDAALIIQYRVYVNGEPLLLNKKYQNPYGEIFEISRFRFYAGKIKPVYTDQAIKNNSPLPYHLVDFSDSTSTRFEIAVHPGNFDGIEFQLGVDSADQSRGAQTGVLDPIKGMYWTWNSGYISFKIEGYSPVSEQPAHMIAYHIGGYRDPYNTVWKLKLGTTNNEVFRISKENKIVVEIPIELDYFFKSPTPLSIKNIPACTTPGELARKISENFIGSFTGLTLSSNP